MKQKDLVFVLGSSAVVALLWIASNLYHAYITSTIEEPLTTLIKPISAKFNTEAINRLTSRQEIEPTYERSGASRPTTVSSASATITPPLPTETTTPTVTPEEGITP